MPASAAMEIDLEFICRPKPFPCSGGGNQDGEPGAYV
jgi:hypothetical protein